MKKSLIALAVMGASTVAFAASNVTLYGVIEEGVLVQKEKGNDTTVQLKAGFDSGNRWGIKGVEELGNGYSVGFILEQGFNVDNGSVGAKGKQFNRESILYIDGGFGQLAFGRTGGLAYAQSQNIRTGWVFGTGYGAAGYNAIDYVAKRMNDVVSYRTPVFSGFSVHAMYSNAGVGDDAVDTEKWSKNGHYYGIGVLYNANSIKSSLIFEVAQNKDQVLRDDRNPKYGIHYGLEWNLGAITPMFSYQYIWQDGGDKDHQFGLSASAPIAGGIVKVGTRYTFGKQDGVAPGEEDKQNAWFIGAAYEYPLSKRTTIKSYAGYTDSGKAWKNEKDVNYNGYQVFLGLTHTF